MPPKHFTQIVSILTTVIILAACAPAGNVDSNGNAALAATKLNSSMMPTLHKIEHATFETPYSCQGSYEKSALFLSGYSLQQEAPDLLFNGTCGPSLYFEASTAGDDFSVISDLGESDLATLSASKAFNLVGIVGHDNIFKAQVPALANHTYSVLISKSDIRALYIFHVDRITPKDSMDISYAVKSYSIQQTTTEAPGFDWEADNK